MNKKIIVTLIVLLFCVSCLSLVSADNDTNETLQSNESEEAVDMSNYIMPIAINGNVIEFSDGFTGFCLDSTKESITTDDGFTSQSTGGDEIQNYVKLAIIEAYKQGCEDNLGQIIARFADGSYKNSNDKVITAVLESQETVGDSAVAELEDSIEGTFEFELLKDANGEKSDCLAYKVSLKEIPDDAKLAAITEDNATAETNDTDNDTSDDNETSADSTDNNTDDKQDDEKASNETDNKTDDSQQNKETIVNETNKTIINKTNTVTINENNTTTINKNNVKVINKTTETPKNATLQDRLIKTVGNPIFLLIVAIAIVGVVVVLRRKE